MNEQDKKNGLWQSAEQVIQKLVKTSAISHLLIMCIVIAIVFGLAIVLNQDLCIKIILVCCLALIIVSFVIAFFFFMFKNPEMLRSETHIIQRMIIEKLGDENNKYNATAKDMIDVINIDNPIKTSEKMPLLIDEKTATKITNQKYE